MVANSPRQRAPVHRGAAAAWIVSVQRDGTEAVLPRSAILAAADPGRAAAADLRSVRSVAAGSATRGPTASVSADSVRRLVELHGGSVEALSAGEGRGERARRPPARPSAAPAAPAALAVPSTLRPTRILIVEDNEDAARRLRLLELDGHQVTAAVSGEDGLRARAVR